MEPINNVTILVNSCDKYEDAWEPFFRLLKIQWPECEKYRIVLNTETKVYNCDFLNVETFNSGSVSWSYRLKEVLDKIDTEYVLFFLEDFFLLEKVQTDIFERAVKLLDVDKSVGLITFNKRRYGSTFPDKPDYENCFHEVSKKVHNRTNVLVSLWRKEYFKKLIYDEENPWEYEKNSNIRSKFAGYKVYTQDYDFSFPAFRYCMNPADGYGITNGKWLCKNKELFESYGILGINYDNLGVFDEQVTYEDISANNVQRKKREKYHRKEILTEEKLSIRIKECIYQAYKSVKKSRLMKNIEYIKKCVKYFWYYKFN